MSQSELQDHMAKKLDLYADHKIKDELVISPLLQTFDTAQMPENNSVGLLRNVQIKDEPVGVVKEENIAEELDLYADHEIKDEMVIGPVLLQTSMAAQTNSVQSPFDKLSIDTAPYKCVICNKCFKTKQELNHHTMRHTGEKPYKCNICKKCFTTKQELNRHIMRNTGEKPFKCSICDKCFIAKYDLKRHLMTHTGEKPYKCKICKKCFRTKQQRNRHIMRHTVEKPYKCDVCDKCFIAKYDLKRHLMRHTGEKPYNCDMCKKCFTGNQKLNHHIMRHTGEKPRREEKL